MSTCLFSECVDLVPSNFIFVSTFKSQLPLPSPLHAVSPSFIIFSNYSILTAHPLTVTPEPSVREIHTGNYFTETVGS